MSETNTGINQVDLAQFLKPAEGEDLEQESQEPDPLADLDPEALLKHPILGPKMQGIIDSRFAAQQRGQTEKIRNEVRAELEPVVTQQVRDSILSSHFSALSQEELAHELASSTDLAAAYARIQAAKVAAVDPKVQEALNTVASVMRVQMTRLDDLPEDVKAQLQPEGYRQYGNEALERWIKDIDAAVKTNGSKVNSAEEEEAKQQEEKAKANSAKPGAVRAVPATSKKPLPDLMTSNSRALLETVLAEPSRS